MLAIAPLLAGLLFFARPLPSATPHLCPAAPLATYPAAASGCSALEITGRADAAGVALDPAFDETTDAAKFARIARGDADVTGYAADGRIIFVLPFFANGSFDLHVPLDAQAQAALRRIRLTTPVGTIERTALAHGEPAAEAIATDDAHFIFAWDATAFPAVRIATSPNVPPLTFSGGTSTYEQLNVDSRARFISVAFSDGVRSFTRTVRVFGR